MERVLGRLGRRIDGAVPGRPHRVATNVDALWSLSNKDHDRLRVLDERVGHLTDVVGVLTQDMERLSVGGAGDTP